MGRFRARLLVMRALPALLVCVPLASLAASPIVLYVQGIRPQDAIALVSAYTLTMLGITLGYHRVLAHRSAELDPRAESVLLALGAMAAQGPPLFWVAHHRAHHRDPDGPRDPHSPKPAGAGCKNAAATFLHSHVGWLLRSQARIELRLVRDMSKRPGVQRLQHRYYTWLILGLTLPAVLVLPLDPSVEGFLESTFWSGLVRLGISHQATWCVNSVCHLWGYRSFETADQSFNNRFVAVLTLGEGWHNNHHASPARARHGLRRWEIDATYAVLALLERLGLASSIKR